MPGVLDDTTNAARPHARQREYCSRRGCGSRPRPRASVSRRTIFSSEPGALLSRFCLAMRRGSRRSAAAVLAHRSARRGPANEAPLPGWKSSDSAAFGRASTTALGGEARAARVARACVVGVELHAHRDVAVCLIECDELTAVLLLRQQRGHAAQSAPGLWNGRERALSARRCACAERQGRLDGPSVVGGGGASCAPTTVVIARGRRWRASSEPAERGQSR